MKRRSTPTFPKLSPSEQIAIAKSNLASLESNIRRNRKNPGLVAEGKLRRLIVLDSIRRSTMELGTMPAIDDLKFWLDATTEKWWNEWYLAQMKKALANPRSANAYIHRTRYALRVLKAFRDWATPPEPLPPRPVPKPPDWAVQRDRRYP
jgi:hypothetical protein